MDFNLGCPCSHQQLRLNAAVIASMKENEEEDIRTLTLSYTGTTQDAAEARNHSRAVMDRTDPDPKVKIKDLTGSGFEHKPGESENGAQVRLC